PSAVAAAVVAAVAGTATATAADWDSNAALNRLVADDVRGERILGARVSTRFNDESFCAS
ncbi:MAG TPA: hypothetical protein VN625_11795, partial [Desulfuromonadaceae bacterium]|nr:hypothetical protein [Desulfuromonadaceae bacterium]